MTWQTPLYLEHTRTRMMLRVWSCRLLAACSVTQLARQPPRLCLGAATNARRLAWSACCLSPEHGRTIPLPLPSLPAKTAASLEQLMSRFDNAAIELMLHHAVQSSELGGRMTSALRAASAGLPKLRVLHCTSYNGCYGLSEKFRRFNEQRSAVFRSQTLEGQAHEHMDNKEGPCHQQQPAISKEARQASGPCSLDAEAPTHIPSQAVQSALARLSARLKDRGQPSSDSQYTPGEGAEVDRLLDADMLVPFAQALTAEWPFITRLVRAYLSPAGVQCRQHVQSAWELVYSRRQRDMDVALRDRVDAALAPKAGPAMFGVVGWAEDGTDSIDKVLNDHEHWVKACWGMPLLKFGSGLLSCAALENLRRFLDAEIVKQNADVAAGAAALDAVPFASEMLASAMARPYRTDRMHLESSEAEHLDFSEAVAKYGEAQPSIWKFQGRFQKTVMQHLASCPQHVAQLLQAQDAAAAAAAEPEVLEALALLAGSTRFCQLSVQLVPQLSEFGIRTHSGYEVVYEV